MTKVRISIPAKSAMQSVQGLENWIIEFVQEARSRSIDPVMGWTSSNDMKSEVKMEFPNLESATEFAKYNDWAYEIIEPKPRKHIKKSYADNFK